MNYHVGNKYNQYKENLAPVELIEFLQIISNGTGDYTKEKYENDEELTIEDFKKYLAEK